jgi:hypothetical protein
MKQMQSFGMSMLKRDDREAGVIVQALEHLIPALGDKS